MNPSIRDELRKELVLRGCCPCLPSPGTASLTTPNDTMVLDDSDMTAAQLAELLDVMVARREKIFRSVDVVGPDAARKSYDDVVLVIEAIKSVIGRLSLA